MGHGLETKVTDVGFLGRDKAAKQLGCFAADCRVAVEVDGKVDGLEKDGVLCITMLDVLGRILRIRQDDLEELADIGPDFGIICDYLIM